MQDAYLVYKNKIGEQKGKGKQKQENKGQAENKASTETVNYENLLLPRRQTSLSYL